MQAVGVGLIRLLELPSTFFTRNRMQGGAAYRMIFRKSTAEAFMLQVTGRKIFICALKGIVQKRETANVQNIRWRFIPIF